ncbi:MAG: tRNA 2-thiouridine(34) synthase MnmA, partial [Clostridia bacterium]|nr:tRNA 2-thiouridine(34) synthase MnmA [Clostridia bacterium]
GMSGGIDSTYAVVKLRTLGYEVEGAILKMSEHTDIAAAERAAEALGVKLHIVDCTEEFRACVVENFVSDYLRARTPNPCIVCNREVKFRKLCECAKSLGIETVSTGHYAHILRDGETGRYYIAKGKDARKDQSYVLWRLSQEELAMLYFPLADDVKTEVKQISKEMALPSAEMGESQEICFIPSNDHTAYIEEYIGKKIPAGNFVDKEGRVLGSHKGVVRYTIGQRKGLGISLGKHAFVTKIDPQANTVTLGDECELFTREFEIDNLVFQKHEYQAGESARMFVKIRYAAPPVPCTVNFRENAASVVLDEPARAITPGQSAVFYDEQGVIFGGFIR